MYKEFEQEKHWNKHYLKKENISLSYDGWLDKYIQRFPNNGNIIDLGCGVGSDTDILLKKGFSVTSVDFSDEALRLLKKLVPEATAIKMDMTEKFLFDTDEFDVVVSDLSLHYFEWKLTMNIMKEIARVLKPNGIFVGRFNSDRDFSFGASDGEIIEPGLRIVKGRTKRFFSKEDVNQLFSEKWNVIYQNENITQRYTNKKIYWEVLAYNK